MNHIGLSFFQRLIGVGSVSDPCQMDGHLAGSLHLYFWSSGHGTLAR